MALRSVSLLLLVVVGLAHETAPSKPDATAAVGPANETSSTWSNFVYCKCGLTCVKQMGSWYIFDLGQSCACQACPEEPADATGHLRGSQETAPKEIPSQENHETEPKPAEKPDAAEHTKDTEGTETKLSLKSLKIAPSTENEDKWEGASVSGSNMLYCKCGKKCAYGRQLGLYTYYCFRYGCNVKQMGSWYIFDLGQSCACQACPEEPADATGHLRGSQETAPKEIPSQENHETEPKPAEKPDAAEHTKDTEGTETKLSLKSLKIAPSTENEDKWEGASVSGSNMLYCT
ncbi:unnamed protein product [Cladocopium goreaui]|uniref:Uncharacterized protein n=1 Tax=Cladocopium goreaui TaxID=2562237 RepID=A0A9P1D878_9DINO|nr:unnamed protein product [Cladocopium goreaui]